MAKGFTCTELLVVVAMGLVAVGLAAPALDAAREMSQQQQCAAKVHMLGLGWAMFRKDYDEQWTREPCTASDASPEAIADLAGFGYLAQLDCFVCPSLDAPVPRVPSLIIEGPEGGPKRYVGRIEQVCYFADGPRIPRDPLPQRVTLADGIEMVTYHGREPANHAGPTGRADGANVLYVDMAVGWVHVLMPLHGWVMDQHGLDGPGGIGFTAGVDSYPHVTGGTWKRYGFIQNVRLLNPGRDDLPGGGQGMGEDDIPNSLLTKAAPDGELELVPGEVDDIYYEECDLATYGDRYGTACEGGFVAKARGARCARDADKDERDCALANGNLWGWRGQDGIYETYPEFQGSEGWGWPEELPPDAVWRDEAK